MSTCTLTLALALVVATEAPAEDAKKVTEALTGYWDVTAAEADGVTSKNNLPYKRLVFTGPALKVTRAERTDVKGTEAQHDARYRPASDRRGLTVPTFRTAATALGGRSTRAMRPAQGRFPF